MKELVPANFYFPYFSVLDSRIKNCIHFMAAEVTKKPSFYPL